MFLYLRFEFFIILSIHHSSTILIILLLRIASGRDPLCLMLFWTLSRVQLHTRSVLQKSICSSSGCLPVVQSPTPTHSYLIAVRIRVVWIVVVVTFRTWVADHHPSSSTAIVVVLVTFLFQPCIVLSFSFHFFHPFTIGFFVQFIGLGQFVGCAKKRSKTSTQALMRTQVQTQAHTKTHTTKKKPPPTTSYPTHSCVYGYRHPNHPLATWVCHSYRCLRRQMFFDFCFCHGHLYVFFFLDASTMAFPTEVCHLHRRRRPPIFFSLISSRHQYVHLLCCLLPPGNAKHTPRQ